MRVSIVIKMIFSKTDQLFYQRHTVKKAKKNPIINHHENKVQNEKERASQTGWMENNSYAYMQAAGVVDAHDAGCCRERGKGEV
ncbi:MAG: hypothetical protein PUB69_03950 [Desulfovibrionaceae bacterium]|nr:hypothetical protein [Desulfovibrionaceae bacterium]